MYYIIVVYNVSGACLYIIMCTERRRHLYGFLPVSVCVHDRTHPHKCTSSYPAISRCRRATAVRPFDARESYRGGGVKSGLECGIFETETNRKKSYKIQKSIRYDIEPRSPGG
uniref:Uncharacterized protein n=1 Tax=Sipha flava TaxID=143950 RepID=A0A2S2QUZ7_9HEMI